MKARMKYDWNNKEKFIEDLKKSTSMSNFLKNNNLSEHNSIFKQKVKDYNINLENIYIKKSFQSKTKIEGNSFPEPSEIFCENCPFPRSFVRKYIKKNKLIPYICTCGNKGYWLGKPITLELEHKNGINNDNRLENLEYLCPNCHSQTITYKSRNNHLKIFEKRIKDLVNLQVVNEDNLHLLSNLWDIQIISLKDWLITHKEKIILYGVKIDLVSKTFIKKDLVIKNIIKKASYHNDNLETISCNLGLNEEETLKLIRVYNFDLYKKLKPEKIIKENLNLEYEVKMKDLLETSVSDYNEILQQKWNMTEKEVILWIKKNAYDYYLKILDYEKLSEITDLNKDTLQREINKINIDISKIERINDVLRIETKKQVLALSKKWRISDTGAKKWIRNNLPDKFKEIYDDKHLEKNKKKVVHRQRINYIESLEENFNEIEAMKFLNLNKTALYAQIKAHNPDLLEKLHNKHLCPKCNYKTRSNGQYRRCLDCNHNFKPTINQTEYV